MVESGRWDVAFAAGLLRPGWAGCDAALAAGLAQPAIVRARGVLACETGRVGPVAGGFSNLRGCRNRMLLRMLV